MLVAVSLDDQPQLGRLELAGGVTGGEDRQLSQQVCGDRVLVSGLSALASPRRRRLGTQRRLSRD
jgi:hypothetical protein